MQKLSGYALQEDCKLYCDTNDWACAHGEAGSDAPQRALPALQLPCAVCLLRFLPHCFLPLHIVLAAPLRTAFIVAASLRTAFVIAGVLPLCTGTQPSPALAQPQRYLYLLIAPTHKQASQHHCLS